MQTCFSLHVRTSEVSFGLERSANGCLYAESWFLELGILWIARGHLLSQTREKRCKRKHDTNSVLAKGRRFDKAVDAAAKDADGAVRVPRQASKYHDRELVTEPVEAVGRGAPARAARHI